MVLLCAHSTFEIRLERFENSESDVCVELRRTVSVSVCLGLLGLALALGLIPRACVCIYVSFSEAEN